MLCDICKKNEAVIHIQEISAAGKKIINLCNDCAEKHPQFDPLLQFGNITFNDVIKNIKKISSDIIKKKTQDEDSPVCPKCGWDFQKMEENNGLLGCEKCYEVFGDALQNTINSIHRSRVHTGKRPAKIKREPQAIKLEKLRKLEEELQTAVMQEEYERAAVLRDEIAALKKKRKKESGK